MVFTVSVVKANNKIFFS